MLNIEKYKDKLVELCVIDIDRLALIQGQPRICNSSLLCNEFYLITILTFVLVKP